MNNKHAVINEKGVVVNMIIWEGDPFLPPHNHMVIQLNDRYEANGAIYIGDTYDAVKDVFILADRKA